ncbi:hypothetical protein [Halorubrum halodurans]|uniref:hypothetical protein n=1 Tax=Halorubrum halodurans TaxID=1383851 RepID=UPI001179E4F8|nr:hypothetical protein [Halorubrum halodurans]
MSEGTPPRKTWREKADSAVFDGSVGEPLASLADARSPPFNTGEGAIDPGGAPPSAPKGHEEPARDVANAVSDEVGEA